MTWGLFGPVHLISLVVSAGLIFGTYFILKTLPEKARKWTLFALSLLGICAIIYNLLAWNSPLEYLPFHMCSITAMMLPIVVLTKNKVMGNLLLVWCIGAIFALLFHNCADFKILSPQFFFYYIPHTFEFAVTVYLFKFKYIKAEPKYIPSTVGITVGIYTVVHFINIALNKYYIAQNMTDSSGVVIESNYMFSMSPMGNPALELFYKIIPYDYWYMYLAVVILVAYLGILFLPRFIKEKTNNKKASS